MKFGNKFNTRLIRLLRIQFNDKSTVIVEFKKWETSGNFEKIMFCIISFLKLNHDRRNVIDLTKFNFQMSSSTEHCI